MPDRIETDADASTQGNAPSKGVNEGRMYASLGAAPDPRTPRSARIMTALDNLDAAQRELTLAIIDGLRP